MSTLLIRGGRVIDPATRTDRVLDVLIRDGFIAEVAPKLTGADEVLDARHLIVAPGFIDLHVHLREPGQHHKETIATGTAAAAAGGFTSVCAMPNTAPVNDSPAITRWMQDPDRGASVNVFPIAAATVASAGERITDVIALRRAGAIAITDDGRPILDDAIMEQCLRAASAAGIPVIQHAEDTRLTANASVHAGPNAFRLGLRGWPVEAEAQIVARDIELARRTGAHLHVAHVSTGAALEHIRRAKKEGIRVTCEVTPHHFTLTDSDVGWYDTHCKMNPPLRPAADRDALIAGLADGAVDAIATDHAPHAPHEKAVEFERAPFGIIGLETALPLALMRLHREHRIPLARLIELFSSSPAAIIGLRTQDSGLGTGVQSSIENRKSKIASDSPRNTHNAQRGTLAPGSIADLCIFDPKKTWTYDAMQSWSLSHNSPFHGWKLTGSVIATIVSGRIVFRVD